jgi:predicted transcriptional regulator
VIIRVKKNKENPYVMMNKHGLTNPNLSWKAKGILAYLLSLPDDWQIYETELVKHAKDGRDSLKKGLQELIDAGYIYRERIRNEKGQLKGYDYLVYEVPNQSGFSNVGFSNVGESATTNMYSTDNDNTKETIYVSKKRLHALTGENDFLDFYLKTHEQFLGKKHVRVTDEQENYINYCISKIVNTYDIELETWQEEVVNHFENLPKSNNGNILAFLKASHRYFEIRLDDL